MLGTVLSNKGQQESELPEQWTTTIISSRTTRKDVKNWNNSMLKANSPMAIQGLLMTITLIRDYSLYISILLHGCLLLKYWSYIILISVFSILSACTARITTIAEIVWLGSGYRRIHRHKNNQSNSITLKSDSNANNYVIECLDSGSGVYRPD